MNLTLHGPPNPRDAEWQARWQHEMASVSEGLCPEHGTPLEPVPVPAGRIAGHCPACGLCRGANLATAHVGWWLDRRETLPAWMSAG